MSKLSKRSLANLEGLCEAGYRVGTRQPEDFPRAKKLLMPCPYNWDRGDGVGVRSRSVPSAVSRPHAKI